ncbi:PREDICTED: dystroglycan [Dinoponera quadriceps]|uniref:Dystroglycan 1 n=1 Tax=Dinoponera quadriceps TaxID=609295 RepID=A0A6P3XKP8_DINQU|nr:PREDICTED: dystroglycan [Dinoponera quadriceps]XP_014478580.1 PREDICTED: dystroglycan [Dinoponera quadriceps]XP_014478581.1 PREDICTED: dystroglycan [Dinoponera quadriceps]
MKKPRVLACVLLLPLALGLSLQEDDLVFDDVGEDNENDAPAPTVNYHASSRLDRHMLEPSFRDSRRHRFERLWGVPDTIVPVGHVFKLKIPRQAFSGNVDFYEVHETIDHDSLPRWLAWDDAASTLSGVPSKKDVGSHHLTVKAIGKHGDTAKDQFVVQVVPENQEELKHKDGKTHCDDDEEQTLLTILLDARLERLSPRVKVDAIENLAGFLGMHTNAFSMHSQSKYDNMPLESSIILGGPGNVPHRRENYFTSIQWQVGCDGHVWRHQTELIKQLREQAKDGTLAEVLQLPVILWRVKTDSSSFLRNRREAGSGDYDNPDDYDGYDDDYDGDYEDGGDEREDDNEDPQVQPTYVPDFSDARGNTVPGHPHRHHHGEETIDWNGEDTDEEDLMPRLRQSELESGAVNRTSSTTPTPTEQTTITTREWTTTSTTTTPVVANVTGATASHTTITTTTTTMTPSVAITNATSATTTTVIPPTTELRTTPAATSSITNATTTSTTVTTTTSTTTTTTAAPTTTTPTTTTVRVTTESIEYGNFNFPPRRDRILKKIPVTAGKPLSYVIPANTFSDIEDGDTRNLKLNLYWQGVPLKPTHWLQFNRHTQEVYGLPLENDISTWNYELVATDREGANVTDHLDIHVQQHKLSRSVNHEFSIYLRIDKRNEFPTDVDWEFKVIRSLAELYGDNDTRHITVRNVDFNTPDHEQQAIFTWTNDSLPRSSECPREHINKLLRVLVDSNSDPSSSLRAVLAPEIRVKRVVYQGIGQCEDMKRPEVPRVSTEEPKVNYPPVPRNQVDHVNATVGQLLVFKVPEDTFFDAEDGSSRNMKMSLLTIDRVPIPPHEWLQFDSKNQEFYGVPMRGDVGRKEYQLVVTDKEGSSATDGLVVVVNPAPHMGHTVEFSMTLDIPYDSFAHSALQKRNFIEKLRDLYGDKDTSAISLYSISNGSTVITWHNRTLPTSYCAHDEVNRLRSVLVKSDNDRRSVTDEVLDVMGLKFPVKQITVIPMGICLGELTGVHSPDSYVPPVDDSTSVGAFHDDYLFTFVLPAIIISIMLIGAGIIACVLYKRRRSGKMSVSEKDEERQSFRSKGIPVIFQDELDEKPDPGNKSPVILKEEKPPLPPPEYQKAEDGADVPMLSKESSEEPYQPPPPFTASRDTNRQNRPKPTPTYRKPPPYVPP